MTHNQSELEEQVSAAIYDTDYKHVIEEPEYFDRAAVDAVVEFIAANYTPNSKLKALIKESEKWNKRMHGRPDCKSCALQEQLAELTKDKL